ncbi:MAG: hypothetical protein ACI9BW_001810, partial [Gammaproteobacteria bacterium]
SKHSKRIHPYIEVDLCVAVLDFSECPLGRRHYI